MVYFRHPGARAHYLRVVADLRAGTLVGNTMAALSIRNDVEMAKSAAGNRARLEAMRLLEGDAKPVGDHQTGGAAIPGIVVQVNLNRGPVEVDETVIQIGAIAAVRDNDAA